MSIKAWVISMISPMCSVARGIWSMPSTPKAAEASEVVLGNSLGEFLDRGPFLLSLDDELVIDVGDVDDPGDLVAQVDEVPLDGVENDGPDHMADVTAGVNGGAADVHAHRTRANRLERFFGLGQRVIDAKRHRRSARIRELNVV